MKSEMILSSLVTLFILKKPQLVLLRTPVPQYPLPIHFGEGPSSLQTWSTLDKLTIFPL